jgi:hypothetical protein
MPGRGQNRLVQRFSNHPALKLVVLLTSFIQAGFVERGLPEEKVTVLPEMWTFNFSRVCQTERNAAGD